MQIQIVRSERFFSSKNQIFVDGKEHYYTSSESLANSHFKLHEIKTGITKSILKHEISLLSDNFKIRLFNPDNVLLHFRRIKWYKHNYFCDYDGDIYEIFFLSGQKSYLYKNGIEIMNYKKESNQNIFSFKREYNFNFTNTEETHLELLITLCLFICVKEADSND